MSDWFLPVLLCVLVVAALGGVWAYQVNAVPEFEQEDRVIEQWRESTTYNHSAVVTDDTGVWSSGERLTDRPMYYTAVSPELDGSYSYEYSAANGSLEVTTETVLLVRGVGENGDDIYWETSEPLQERTTDSLAPGEAHSTAFTVDIEAVRQEIADLEEELRASEGTVDVRVVSTSEIAGEIEGEQVETTYDSEMPIDIGSSTFSVGDLETVDEPERSTELIQTPVQPSPLESIGSILVFAVALAAAIALLAGRNTNYIEITDDEKQRLRFERERERFDEWITTGTFPSEREYESTILVDDLTGLIDVAIDTNKRVIEDQQLGVSTVLDEEYSYIYVHPGSPARDWLLNFADETIDEFESNDF
ncbi:hypothetical protein HALLA_02420 (plasmid) [Halostagnicola larsenii XH-48]|uniref:DUF5305 domain-containing protein n=1 Tax=Halostagnicola larsenii XH-48 TaxID=797299 RepID=W0JV81_9EURY|nr:DUF5305 domain-containing protein [Halostagnicola larsenii]AHG01252.1 hypothetical protein HALLA_02420 [Halostagnicola larsenii XH-48]